MQAHLGKTGKALEIQEHIAAKMLSGAFGLQRVCQHYFMQLGILNSNKLGLLKANPSMNALKVKSCSFSFRLLTQHGSTPHHKQIFI